MSHFEERLERDLRRIRADVYGLGTDVASALEMSVDALLTGDTERAYLTVIGDHPINRRAEALDQTCHHFIAKHLPSAGHLRFISSVMRITILLERMGDYAVNVARSAASLDTPLSGSFRSEVKSMAEDALQMFKQALEAFRQEDDSLARGTMGFADQVDRDFSLAYEELTGYANSDFSAEDLFGRLVVISQLERVSDQAKNLCELVVFAVTGETKQRGPLRILVVDSDDAGPTHLAVALARKFHAGKVVVDSAGRQPASTISPDVRSFMDKHGLDTGGLDPSGFDWPEEDWKRYDVVLSLDGPVSAFLDSVPFHTVAFDWTPESDSMSTEDWYRYLQDRMQDLVSVLRGTDEQQN